MGSHDPDTTWHTHPADAAPGILGDGRTLREGSIVYHSSYPVAVPEPGAQPVFLLRRSAGLIPDTVLVRTDQFLATEWEARHSALSATATKKFVPVIDDNSRVVGHVGWIEGWNIYVPKNTIGERSPLKASLEEARRRTTHQRIVDSYKNQPSYRFPAQPVASPQSPAPCWPANKNSLDLRHPVTVPRDSRPGDEGEEMRLQENINFLVEGGGKAIVGTLRPPDLDTDMDRYLSVVGAAPSSFSRIATTAAILATQPRKAYRFQVMVAPDGLIQRVLGVQEFQPESQDAQIYRIAFKVIDIALDILMIIDIVGIPVALIRLTGELVARDALIEAIRMHENLEVKAILEGATREAAGGARIALSASKTLTGVAVSARDMTYAVEHVPGRTFILGADMAKVRSAMASIPTEEGVHDLLIHGTPEGFEVLIKIEPNGDRVWRKLSVREVADAVRAKLPPGVQLRLLSCDTGIEGAPAVGLANNEMAAQQLANELNRTVWGADATVYTQQVDVGVNEARKVFIPKWGELPDGTPIYGKFHEFTPQRGSAALKGNGGNLPANEAAGEINRVHPRPPGPGR